MLKGQALKTDVVHPITRQLTILDIELTLKNELMLLIISQSSTEKSEPRNPRTDFV